MVNRFRWLYPLSSCPPPDPEVEPPAEDVPFIEDRFELPRKHPWIEHWPRWLPRQEFFSDEPPQDEHEDPPPDVPEDVEPEELHEEENCLLLRPEHEDTCLRRGEVDPTQLRRAPECPDSFACPNTGCS